MGLIDQDALLDRRVLVHDRFYQVDIGIEDPDAGQVAFIGDGTDYGHNSPGPEEEVPSGVLPDDLLRTRAAVVWASLQDYDAVFSGAGEHLGHEFVGDFGHGSTSNKISMQKPTFRIFAAAHRPLPYKQRRSCGYQCHLRLVGGRPVSGQ